MKNSKLIKIIFIICFAIFSVFLGIIVGGKIENIRDILEIILHKLFGFNIDESISQTKISIIWDIRLPRVLLSFLVGGMLSVSGAVIQSVLRNPLASSYTIGISSGASLGIGLFIVLEVATSYFIYPVVGFICSIITAIFVIYLSKKIDKYMSNNTIILIGMVVSLFLNAFLTFVTSIQKESLSSIIIWQMGSFSSRGWEYMLSIIPFFLISIIGIMMLSNEMDILTFGDEMCSAVGVNLNRTKVKLLIFSTILTGASIASSGIIGFVDLITPHISRKLFGSKHVVIVHISMILGGALMVMFDIIARFVIYPAELPISTVNVLIGTPIFCYIFFKKNRR